MAQAMNKQHSAPDPMAHYRDIGAYLREMREYYGLSIDEVAGRLHIRNKYLAALEDGRMTDLPGRVYTLGYLQAYAEFLGLDAQQVAQQYQGLQTIDRQRMFKVVEPNQRQGRPAMKVILASVATLLVAFVLWQTMSSPQNSGQDPLVEPVPERMLMDDAPALTVTADNQACLQMGKAAVYPPCYRMNRTEPAMAFAIEPVRSVMELQ